MPSRIAEKSGEGLAVFLSASLAFSCALFFTLGPGFERDFYALWALGLLFAAWVTAALGLRADSSAELEGKGYKLPLFFFFASLAVGLYRLDYFSVWFDEALQANCTHGPYSIVIRAAYTQMPLSYYFTALGISWLGGQEWGLRIFPCLFVAGSAALFSRAVNYCTRDKNVRFFGPLAYVFHPWIIRYSQEGRPYGCALFCTLLWLLSVRAYFYAESSSLLRSRVFYLATATILLGLSIALQALLLILSLAVLMALVFVFLPKFRARAALVFAVQMGVALSLWPLVRLSMDTSRKFLHSSPSLAGLEIYPAQFLSRVQALLLFWPPVYLIVPAIAVVFWKARRRERGVASDSELLAGLFGGILIVFAISFWVSFSVFVQYELGVRYYIVALPLMLLVLMSSLSALMAHASRKILPWCLVGFFLAIYVPELRVLPDEYQTGKFDHWNVDYRNMFRTIHEVGMPGDVAYVLPFQDPSNWEQPGFIAAEVYSKPGDSVYLTDHFAVSHADSAADLIQRDLSVRVPKSVFLAFFPFPPFDQFFHQPELLGPKDAFYSGGGYSLFRLDAGADWAAALDRFLTRLAGRSKPKQLSFRVYDVLLRLAEHRRDREACSRWLDELAPFREESDKIRQIWGSHREKCRAIATQPISSSY